MFLEVLKVFSVQTKLLKPLRKIVATMFAELNPFSVFLPSHKTGALQWQDAKYGGCSSVG
jgi:hypothetical protein